MLDDQDEGTRIGVWVALGATALVIFGLLFGLLIKQGKAKAAPSTRMASTTAANNAATPPSAASMMSAAPVAPSTTATAATTATSEATRAPAAAATEAAFVEAPLAGEKIGAFYFAVGNAALPADAASSLAAIKAAAQAAPGKKLVLSGFHDASGDPAKNAELAKNRAKAVRTALQSEGVAPERIALRKPESTTGDGNSKEARRVEVRLAE
jgi:outer membrane protein OmpA-like peptidoglycan-associated protein